MSVTWRDLDAAPSLLPLYQRAALKRKISGDSLPLHGVRCTLEATARQLAAYRRVCGFDPQGVLPATWPHVLSFALQLHLLTDSKFPFPLLGLVHLSNRINVLRPLASLGQVRLSVHAEGLQAHPKGASFSLVTRMEDALGVLWEEHSRMLCRGAHVAGAVAESGDTTPAPLTEVTRWYAPKNIGRRYARVSGDYNPIHLSAPTAKLFGFPQAIAHGMWTKARALAALAAHLPASGYQVEVQFHKPLRLPSEVILSASAPGPNGQLQVLGLAGQLHMSGQWRANPIASRTHPPEAMQPQEMPDEPRRIDPAPAPNP